ncbi:efflux RND transporter periplasmic adaptor subunit [Candidatus Peregrinibacteria bacterium]|nr:MAG: efflux RND transporter periplasmic adaptor subunit [Candidatus Peregrinibacteria bacterium]
MEKKQRFYKKSFFIGLLTVLLPFGIYVSFGKNAEQTQKTATDEQTTLVARGNIRQTIKVLGEANLVDEQKLRFNKGGKVAAVYFQDGDQVKQDEVIAELDKADGLNDIRQAEINLENSKLSLQEILKGNDESQVLKAKNTIEETNQQIELAKQNLKIAVQDEQNTNAELDIELSQAEKDVSDKLIALDNTKKELENAKIYEDKNIESSGVSYQSSLDDALLSAKDAIVDTDSTLSKLDLILGIEENTKKNNDEYELYLGFRDQNTKTVARDAYMAARNSRRELEGAVMTFEKQESAIISDAEALLRQSIALLEFVVKAADTTYTMLQNTITGTNFTQSELDSFKSSALSARSSAQSSLSSFNNKLTALANLEELDVTERRSGDTISNKEESVRSAETTLTKAQDSLTNLKNSIAVKKGSKRLERVGKENDVKNLESSLVVQKEELADLEKGESKERIAMAENDVAQKELAMERVQDGLDTYELSAPFDGVLRKIDFQVGDNILADEDKFVYIENPDLFKITILLDQIDIVKIKEGASAKIIFDALPDQEFSGEIEEINSTPVQQSGVVSYEASITLHKENEPIFSGMTSSIEIILQEKKGVLLVPNLAVTSRGGSAFVQRMENGVPHSIKVITGLSDGKNTEILSGIEEGDEIVVANFSALGSVGRQGGNQQDTVRQFMRASGGGGGGTSFPR